MPKPSPATTTVIVIAGEPYPPTLSTDQTARLWGCSSERLYDLLDGGSLPVQPLKLGRRYRWPTVPVAQAVGLPVEIVHRDGDAAA